MHPEDIAEPAAEKAKDNSAQKSDVERRVAALEHALEHTSQGKSVLASPKAPPLPKEPSLLQCNRRHREVLTHIRSGQKSAMDTIKKAIQSTLKLPGNKRVQKPLSPHAANLSVAAKK
jgi:hypothetical protein